MMSSVNSRRDPALRRLVHQVLWPGFNGTTVPSWLAFALEEGLAGALYFSQNFDADDPGQPGLLSRTIHGMAPDALLGVDEEGGIVTRLQSGEGSQEPGNAVLGRIDDTGATYRSGRRIGSLVAQAGIDIDLAPVVDVNSDARNPVIAVRSFGSDPLLVCRHASAMVRGIQEEGVACCIKHFPGYGDVVADPHHDIPVVHRTRRQTRSIHLPPFAAAIRAGAQCVMAAHIPVPYIPGPVATLNPQALQPLREELGFEGVVICDALDMGAVSLTTDLRHAGAKALLAGNDLLCIGNPADKRGRDEDDFAQVRDGIFDALDEGSLPIRTLEQAQQRLARLRAWSRSCASHGLDARPVSSADGEQLRLARAAMEVRGDVRLGEPREPVLLVDARASQSPVVGEDSGSHGAHRFFRALTEAGISVSTPSFSGDDTGQDALISHIADGSLRVVVIAGQLLPGSGESLFVRRILATNPRTIVIQTGWPAGDDVADHRIRTYGDSLPCARAAAMALLGIPGNR
ncbi:MAG: glycoside hydrolase family 3 N-terminal domain-containing protein [Bifidobacterium sp.]|jgi:beta-N-acetylhexosaminidase